VHRARDKLKSAEEFSKCDPPPVQISLLLTSMGDSVSHKSKEILSKQTSFVYKHFPVRREGSGLGRLCLAAALSG
jgi:hypothetical protein